MAGAACPSELVCDDDNSMEAHTSTDYTDDYMQKTLAIASGSLANAGSARLWMFLQPYACANVSAAPSIAAICRSGCAISNDRELTWAML